MAEFTIEALAAEINLDPALLIYKVLTDWKGDQEIADIINTKNRTVDHVNVKTSDIRALTTYDAFDGFTTAEEAWFRWATNGEFLAVTSDTKLNLAGIGGNSKWATPDRAVMNPRMVGLMQFQGSRAEELWGEGVEISPSQVGAAANV